MHLKGEERATGVPRRVRPGSLGDLQGPPAHSHLSNPHRPRLVQGAEVRGSGHQGWRNVQLFPVRFDADYHSDLGPAHCPCCVERSLGRKEREGGNMKRRAARAGYLLTSVGAKKLQRWCQVPSGSSLIKLLN